MRLIAVLLMSVCSFAQDSTNWKRWIASDAVFAAGTIADAYTSVKANANYGIHETNPLLCSEHVNPLTCSSTARYVPARGSALKGAQFGATVFVEYLVIRKYPRSEKWFSILNFTYGAGFGAIAYRNELLLNRR